MNSENVHLYSAMSERQVLREASLPVAMGHQIHAMFLLLIARRDPGLAVRLHDESGCRPLRYPLFREKCFGGTGSLCSQDRCIACASPCPTEERSGIA